MTEKTETIKKILRIALRVARIVLYIAWLLLMLLFILFLTAILAVMGESSDLNVVLYIDGWIFSVLNIETGLVLLRKYSKILGVFHILLGFFCLILALVLTLLYA